MSSERDVVIACEGVGKAYRIYGRPQDRLRQAILPRLARWTSPLVGRLPGQLGLQLSRRVARGDAPWYTEFEALRDISFEVRRGETIGIVGRNGSGKSTLLQVICGTLVPTTGRVETHGRMSALLELGAGFNPEFTGVENVRLYASMLGLSRREIDARFDDIAAFADIGAFIGRPVKTYSSGMYVRLAFAVAVNVDPEILVVDEALSVGDFAFQAKCVRRMRRFLDEGGTMLFVSHDVGAIKSLCSRALYLRGGRMREIGPADLVVRRYLGDVNHDEGLVQGSGASLTGGAEHRSLHSFRQAVAPFRRHTSEQCEFVSVEVLDRQQRAVGVVGWGELLTVRVALKIHRHIESLAVALYVRDKLQVDLMGTNSVYEDVPLRAMAAGELVELQFEFPNHLSAGEYGICVIASDQPVTTQHYYDWIDLAASFRSVDRPGTKTWAIFNPGIRVSATRNSEVAV
jgi:lipopolysaccharide transport system ATP-binding protein